MYALRKNNERTLDKFDALHFNNLILTFNKKLIITLKIWL